MKILCFSPKDSAVSNYRMMRPLSPLGALFRRTVLRKNEELPIKELAERLKKQGDVWVIKYISKFETLNTLYSMRNMVPVTIVVDIDDNIWQIPPDSAAFGNSPTAFANRAMMVAESVRAADYVTVSTPYLEQLLKSLNPNITVLPNLIDPKEWHHKRKAHKKVRIGWVYSPTHYPDAKEISEALSEVAKKYGDKIEFVIIGTMVDDLFPFPYTKVEGVKYDQYPKLLQEASLDISIAPLQVSEFNRGKSNIKWMESTMAGAAFVGTDLDPYSMVRHGETGLLATTKNEWVNHLSTLIENDTLRHFYVERAKQDVLKHYNIETNTQWKDFYESIASSAKRKRAGDAPQSK